MPFVLDTSITMAWCFADEIIEFTQDLLNELLVSYAEVPTLWMYEVANVLAINERKGRITRNGSEHFLNTLAALDIRVQTPIGQLDSLALIALARQHGLTAYDAAYLELAKRRGLPLASFDKDLVRAAPLAGVALLRPENYIK